MADERHGDHHALAHASAHLVRVVVHPLARIGDADEPQHLDRPRPCRLAPQALMDDGRFGDLVPHGEHRVERGHRLLENHRNPVAADRAQLLGSQCQQVASLELDEAAGADVTRRLGDEAEDGERRDRLTAAGLADDAERLAGVHVERDAVDRAGGTAAVLGHEIRLQVAHPEQGLRHVASLRGSRASRSPSPTALSASTTSAMARPGNPAVQGAVAMYG